MPCSPEQSRINGRKSRGPKTKRGKDIVSRNATKHGLLTQKPPLLASEDLESFQGVMQSLIDEWQPQGTTEHMLLQQLAMAFQRQYRLWAAEAAMGSQPMLELEKKQRFPERKEPGALDKLDFGLGKTLSARQQLDGEAGTLQWMRRGLMEYIEGKNDPEFLAQLEEDEENIQIHFLGYVETHRETAKQNSAAVWMDVYEFWSWLAGYTEFTDGVETCHAPLDEAVSRAEGLCQSITKRLVDIAGKMVELDQFELKQAQNDATAKQIPLRSLDLLMRYESNIRDSIESAIAQLEAAQNRRKATAG